MSKDYVSPRSLEAARIDSQATDQPNSFHVSDPTYTGKSETKSSGFQPISLTDLLAQEPGDIPWKVDQVFPAEGVGIIGGTAGIGKSWLLLDLAIECARGGLWLGKFEVSPGRVFYIDEESSPIMASVRLRKLLAGKGLTSEGLEIQLVIGQGVQFSSGKSISHLSALLEQFRPDTVILDSLVRLHRADENSATDMAKVFETVKGLVRRFKCLFVFADHHRKPGILESSGDSSLRGSSEKVAFVDTLLSLKKSGEKTIVEHSKARSARPVDAFEFVLDEPVEGKLTIRVLGDHETIKRIEKHARAAEFIKEVLADGQWKSRPELLEMALQRLLPEKALDGALRDLVPTVVERDDRSPQEGGRGGKIAHFRLRTTFHVSPIYSTGKSETETLD
jgi:hypothetical protein